MFTTAPRKSVENVLLEKTIDQTFVNTGCLMRHHPTLGFTLKGNSGVSLIHGLTHLDTEYDPPPRELKFADH